MDTITCKTQGLARHLTTRTSISGFEGPSPITMLDDGYGNPVMKGQITHAFDAYYTEKFYKNGTVYYDGEIEIYDTPFNRAKIAVHVRSRDMRVVNRNLEQEILSQFKKSAAAKQSRFGFDAEGNADVPAGFEGRYAVARRAEVVVDSDPIVDPGDDAEFKEVVNTIVKSDLPAEEEEAPIKKSAAEIAVEIESKTKAKEKKAKVLPTPDVEGSTPAAEAAV